MKETHELDRIRFAVTGHRSFHPSERERFFEHLTHFLMDFDLEDDKRSFSEKWVFCHGCAVGVDLWFGEYAMARDIPLRLYFPFPFSSQVVFGKFNEHQISNLKAQREYLYLEHQEYIGKKYNPQVYGSRNRRLVNEADILLTYYTRERSGSGHARRYAIETKKPVVDLYGYEKCVFNVPWIGGDNYESKSVSGVPERRPRRRAVRRGFKRKAAVSS